MSAVGAVGQAEGHLSEQAMLLIVSVFPFLFPIHQPIG